MLGGRDFAGPWRSPSTSHGQPIDRLFARSQCIFWKSLIDLSLEKTLRTPARKAFTTDVGRAPAQEDHYEGARDRRASLLRSDLAHHAVIQLCADRCRWAFCLASDSGSRSGATTAASQDRLIQDSGRRSGDLRLCWGMVGGSREEGGGRRGG